MHARFPLVRTKKYGSKRNLRDCTPIQRRNHGARKGHGSQNHKYWVVEDIQNIV